MPHKLKGQATVESLISMAVLIAALTIPVNKEGLPDTEGQSVFLHLRDSLRHQHATWLFHHSLPGS